MSAKVSHVVIACVAVGAGFIALCGEALAEMRVALVIGNSAYEHTARLKNPANDSQAIAASLKRLGFTVVEGRDLTRAAFKEKLRDFASLVSGSDVALLFYAGHGLQVAGENWLIPIDTDVRSEMDLELGAIPLATVLKTMERGARMRLVLLDACRDNPMATQLAQGLGNRSGSVGRGLARVEADVGTLIAYSTQPGAVAKDGAGTHSPFTAAMLEVIATPGLEIRQMLTRVRTKVVEATDQSQVPWDHSSLVGDFFFVPGNPSAAPSPPSEPPHSGIGRLALALAKRVLFDESMDSGYFKLTERWIEQDFEGMITEASKALVEHPNDGLLYVFRGQAYVFQGQGGLGLKRKDCERALPDLRRAMTLSLSQDARWLAHYSAALCEGMDHPLPNLDAGIAVNPDIPDLYVFRSAYYVVLQRYSDALEDIEKAIAIEPDQNMVAKYSLRGRLKCMTGDTAGGLTDLARLEAMQLTPDEVTKLAKDRKTHCS
jgi:hypothetical protein